VAIVPSLKGANMKTASELLEDMGTAVPMPNDSGETVAQLWELWGKEWVEGSAPDSGDIYLTLNRYSRKHREAGDAVKPDALAMVCTGWAAPLGENGEVEGAPSKHPKRRRVVLFNVITPSADVASRLLMGDDEPTDDTDGSGTGALADALDACAVSVWGSEFTASLVMKYATGKADGADASSLARLIGRVENVAPLVGEALGEGEGE
jgi:hypothetical protein